VNSGAFNVKWLAGFHDSPHCVEEEWVEDDHLPAGVDKQDENLSDSDDAVGQMHDGSLEVVVQNINSLESLDNSSGWSDVEEQVNWSSQDLGDHVLVKSSGASG